jgi:TonB family protein
LFEASPAAGPPSRFLGISVVAHAAAIVLLTMLPSSPATLELPERAWRVTLIAPGAALFNPGAEPNGPPLTNPLQVAHGRQPIPTLPATHQFRATVADTLPAIIDPAPVPAPEIPQVSRSTTEAAPDRAPDVPPDRTRSPHVASLASGSLKTDNFADVHAGAPDPAPARITRPAGFSSIETSERDPSSPHPSLARATGSFDTASADIRRDARSTAPRPVDVTRLGGFSDNSAASATFSPRGAILKGAFGDSSVALNLPNSARKSEPAPASTPVEILFKPRPLYTAEARRLQIEGEVLLEMQFGAGGEARILRVVRGLGHGLDETAMAAAREIRFRPAERDGAPLDSAAIVHIVFQLAY